MTVKIEPQGHINVSEKHRNARIKNEIIREVKTFQIPYVANAKTVLLFDPSATLQELLASLDVLRKDLQLRTKES
jgi:hypothetical protein